MEKYDVRFCSCGRVHFINQEKVNQAIENEKQVLVICNNCGNSFVIGADKSYDEYLDQEIYNMYSFGMRDTEVNDLSKIDSIVFTAGEQIRMMTGGAATYQGDCFIDWETKKPDNISIGEWGKMQKTVNTQHTINWIKDEDKLEQMSNYVVGIDWKGTKYEKAWS